MKYSDEEKKKIIIEKIQNFCLMDDDYMTKFFEDDLECTSLLLQIIMENPDLRVLKSISQSNIKNLNGRSVRLDIKATDSEGKIYDIEIQKSDKGACVKRARYNSSLMDANYLKSGEEFDNLPETYVIFITENDIIGGEKPIYHIDRMILETNKSFGDESHIIYVNGAFKSDSTLGTLIHDFNCKDPSKMKLPAFADRAKALKQYSTGENRMSKIVEELLKELYEDERKEDRALMKKEMNLMKKKVTREVTEEVTREVTEEVTREVTEEITQEMIINMLNKNLNINLISEITKYPPENIQRIADKIKMKA